MFQCLKVLARLSREDNIIEKMETRYAQLADQLQETETKLKEVKELNRTLEEMASGLRDKISEDKASLEKLESQMENCGKQIQEKFLEIKASADKYLDEMNAKVQSYDSNISAVEKSLKDLREAVAEFQR
jgi:chromosome segregation ATPase